MGKITIPLPESIKESVEKFYNLLRLEGKNTSNFFVIPLCTIDPRFDSPFKQYNSQYGMAEHKVVQSFNYETDKGLQVFFCNWVYPDFECQHENSYVPDAEYNAKYNKVLFPDAATEVTPVTEPEDVGASS